MTEQALDQRIMELLKQLRLILDIGCGDGRLVNALISEKESRVIGLDVSDHGFAEAKMTAIQEAHHHLVECVECDACQIAFQDDYFEAIILRFSLHHIEVEIHLPAPFVIYSVTIPYPIRPVSAIRIQSTSEERYPSQPSRFCA